MRWISDARVVDALRLRDPDVQEILQRRVWDMHVHLGGARTGERMWLDLLLRRRTIEELPDLPPFLGRSAQRLAGPFIGLDYAIDAAGENLHRSVEMDAELLRDRFGASEARNDARREREILFAALQADEWRLFDRYMNAKSAFLSAVMQPGARTGPGLGHFGRHFNAARTVVPNWSSRRLKTMLDEALEPYSTRDYVNGVEFRIGPATSKREYFNLENLARENRGSGPQIRWGIHFHRTLDHHRRTMRQNPATACTAMRAHIAETARATAIFHAYRLQRATSMEAPPLHESLRIDVAGRERDGWFEGIAFLMRLLRGDREARAQLRLADTTLYGHWVGLAEFESELAWEVLPVLHASCHAGEDFAHPAEGLEAIDFTLDTFDMGGGDSIGHALALGAPDGSSDIVVPYCPVVRQLDVLVWMHERATAAGAQTPLGDLMQIERALDDLYRVIGLGGRRPSSDDLHELTFLRRGPIRAPDKDCDGVTRLFALRHHPDWHVNFARPIPLHPIFRECQRVLELAREHVVSRLEHTGVVVEINPSSNFRVSGAATALFSAPHAVLDRWSILRMVTQYGERIAFTIATDDPGVFGADLEGEYALMLHGLSEYGWPRQRTLAFLDACRRNSVRLGGV